MAEHYILGYKNLGTSKNFSDSDPETDPFISLNESPDPDQNETDPQQCL